MGGHWQTRSQFWSFAAGDYAKVVGVINEIYGCQVASTFPESFPVTWDGRV
jgi:hypothetical protein